MGVVSFGEEEEEEEEAASVRSLIRGLIRKRVLEERKRARERGSNAFLSGALHRGKRKKALFSLLRTGVKRFGGSGKRKSRLAFSAERGGRGHRSHAETKRRTTGNGVKILAR